MIDATAATRDRAADPNDAPGAALRRCRAALGIVAMLAIAGAGADAASAQACRNAGVLATNPVKELELYRFEAGKAVFARKVRTSGIAAHIEDCGDNSYYFYRDPSDEMFLVKRAALLLPEKCLAQSTVKAGTPSAGACSR